MRSRVLAGGLLALLLAGCGGRERPAPSVASSSGPINARVPVVAEPNPKAAAKLISRSIWAVIPNPPARKQDLRSDMIRGSAVAISGTNLLTSCAAIGERAQVGLVRHTKFRLARVIGTDTGRTVCVLSAPDAPLNAAPGWRWCEAMRVGEPVFALASRTSADAEITEGRVTGKAQPGEACELMTTLALPRNTQSAVLFDGDGRLLGLGPAGPRTGTFPVALAAPMAAAYGGSATGPAPAPTSPQESPDQDLTVTPPAPGASATREDARPAS